MKFVVLLFLALGLALVVIEARPHRHRRHHHKRHHKRHHKHHNCVERCKLVGRDEVCSVEEACKKVEALQDLLEAQTAAMAAQGKNLAGRLDAAEGKMVDIETIGKKLTDLLAVQQEKIGEQGAALAGQEGKLMEQVNKQADTLKAKIAAQDAKFAAIEENGQKLDTAIAESDGKITNLQNEGVKLLDTLAGQEKKLTAALGQQAAKLSAELPVPDGKFTEIGEMNGKVTEKMDEADGKIAAAAAGVAALKEKVSAAGVTLSDMTTKQGKTNDKIDAQTADIDTEATTAGNIAEMMKGSDDKMNEVAAQGSALAEKIGTSGSKVNMLASANLKQKEKLTKQAEQLAEVGIQASTMATKLKDQAAKIAKIEDDLKVPPEPAPAAAPPPAAAAAAGPARTLVQRCPSNGNKRHTHVEKMGVHGKCRKDQKFCTGGKCRSDVADEAAETVAKQSSTMDDILEQIKGLDVLPFPVTSYDTDPEGTLLAKDNEPIYLPKLPKTFEVAFEVKTTAFQPGWNSVIHLTTGGNCCGNGQRIPGVWYNNKKLMTVMSINGNGNWWKWHGREHPVDQWVKIRINQKPEENGKYMYRVFQDNYKVIEAENSQPEEYKHVKVYSSDPWHKPQAGFIRNLVISKEVVTPNPLIFFDTNDDGFPLKKNNEIGQINVLTKGFSIEFELKPNGFPRGWRNVVHLTIGGNRGMGRRIPSMWFYGKKIKTMMAISGNWNAGTWHGKEAKPGEWNKFKIEQENVQGKFTFRVFQNDEKVIEKENKKAAEFKDVKLFCTDPWYPPADASIRNLKIKTD